MKVNMKIIKGLSKVIQNYVKQAGIYSLANGDSYVGSFKDDNFNGKGFYNFANGSKYNGEYVDGKRNGFGNTINNIYLLIGSFYFINGDLYKGNYENDIRTGKGIF